MACGFEGVLYPGEYVAGGDAPVSQFFSEGVNSPEAFGCARCIWRVNLRMHHAPPVVECLRFAEKDVFAAGLVELLECFYAPELHDFDGGSAVGKETHEPHFRPFALGCERYEAATHLNCGHVAR